MYSWSGEEDKMEAKSDVYVLIAVLEGFTFMAGFVLGLFLFLSIYVFVCSPFFLFVHCIH